MQPPAFLQPLLQRPVAILGGGVSGRGAARLALNLGAEVRLYDLQSPDPSLRDFSPSLASHHALVVFSPGFPPTHPWLASAHNAGCVCLNELDFASTLWRGSVVAITGTNGKTTLTSFLAHALLSLGRDVAAVGNIGLSFADFVADRDGGGPDSLALCEVSSYQAETLRHFRADAALWTNFAEDHLERHGDLPSYFNAKWRLLERTIGGHVHVGSSVQRHALAYGQSLPAEACVSTDPAPGDLLLQGTPFAHDPQRENFLLAAAWWRGVGLRESTLYAAARTFTLAPHRLQPVAERHGVTFWDDSKATNFHAVEAALTRFPSPVLLLLGGKSKGGDIAAFVHRIAPRVKHAFLLGETRHVLATFCGSHHLPYTLCDSLADAVQHASTTAVPGDHVLLSPGFSSFDQFTSYQDRGTQFTLLVNNMGTSPVLG